MAIILLMGVISVGFTANVYAGGVSSDGIHEITPSGGFAITAGGEFYLPSAVATDGDGNVYVADTDNYRIQKFDPEAAYNSHNGGIMGAAMGNFIIL